MYSKFMFLFFIRYVRNRIDHWCTVKPGNPNPRVYRSNGKLCEASFPTGTVDPRVGISLSPLNTNDGFSLSITVYFSQIFVLITKDTIFFSFVLYQVMYFCFELKNNSGSAFSARPWLSYLITRWKFLFTGV